MFLSEINIGEIFVSKTIGIKDVKQCIYEICKLSNETDFLFTKVFFLKINVTPFNIVPLGSYTPMETLFPLLPAALEIFNRYGLQHVC